MLLGLRLREIRELMSLSQGDIEKTTGLLRCYVSRVENGHTIPTLETLEKWAHAFSIPVYRIFYDGEEPPKPLKQCEQIGPLWGSSGREASELRRLRHALKRMDRNERQMLLSFAARVARDSRGK